MNNEKIGILAGNIWEILQEKNEISISSLPKLMGGNEAITYQALGWLAREGKIEYHIKGRNTFVSLVKL